MTATSTRSLPSLVQRHVLDERAALAARFRAASPFPHLVLDEWLDDGFCAQVLEQFPAFERGSALNEDGRLAGKAVCEQVRSLGPAFADLDDLVQSREFLDFMGDITGIPDLLYDPDYVGGGTHENRANQELSPHVDFNYHPRHGWHRRLNLILYLNPVWDEAWGGALDLHEDPWRPAEQEKVRSVLPLMNRCVIFETSERSWHGFRRITPPADRPGLSRRSFAIYLYSEERSADEVASSHSTVYVERPLPSAIRAGTVLSEEDNRTVGELIARRGGHIDRLVRREQQFLEELRRQLQLDAAVSERRPLTAVQADTLEWLIARQDEHLRYLYEREKQFTDRLQKLETEQIRATLPLRGSLTLAGEVKGYWSDRWAGARLAVRCRAGRLTAAVRISGHVPETLTEGQDLTLTVGGRSWERHIAAGSFEWVVPVELDAGTEHRLEVSARRAWRPSRAGASTDGRDLAWNVAAIEGVAHDER